MKYELTTETKVVLGRTLYRIRALVAFGYVQAGELGGWIEQEYNLSQTGNAWVYGDAQVYGDARVSGNARVWGGAQIYGNAWVSGKARVYGNACVCCNARVYGNTRICCDARVSGNAQVYGNAWVGGKARVSGNAQVWGKAQVYGDARVFGNTRVCCDAEVEKPVHLLVIGAVGSRNGFTTFFRAKDKQIKVACGGFEGTIAEFAEKVKQTHGDSKHAKTYALAIELAKAQIEDVEA